jgi:hypothetical protein
VIDLETWAAILARLEDLEDAAIVASAAADLEALARGERPSGWVSWSDVEAELEALEAQDDLSA